MLSSGLQSLPPLPIIKLGPSGAASWFLSLKKLTQAEEDGGEIGGGRVHFPLAPVKHLADLRDRVNSQRYSSIYEDHRPKIVEDIERSDSRKSA